MKTITYNPETHVLVPRDLIADAKQIFCSDVEPNTNGDCLDVIEWFSAMIAAAPQPESVAYTTPRPDRVAELEAETTKLKLDLLTSYGEAEELSGKVAELEAALKVAKAGIDEFLVANDPTEFGCACDLSVGYLCGPCHADKQQQPLKSALAKINEVLK